MERRPNTTAGYQFTAIRGVQAGREYYVTMCPLRLLPRIFIFDDQELPPEVRAQRVLNWGRIPEIASYIVDNPSDYVFSAITASIDSKVEFEPIGDSPEERRLGVLKVPLDARFIINDGQHRRAAIEDALKLKPELGNESIAAVFFLDIGLARCQQMFADLNRYAIRTSRSLGVLYDQRDEKSKLAKLVVLKSEIFRNIVEMESSKLSPRSRKLFTLSAFYFASIDLIEGIADGNLEHDADIARDFWESVAKNMTEWLLVRDGKISAGEVRQDFVHVYGVTLHAIARAGNILLRNGSSGWKTRLKRLRTIDWSRKNLKVWEGRAMIGGRVSKATNNLVLTTNVIKKSLDIDLTPEEQAAESKFLLSRQ